MSTLIKSTILTLGMFLLATAARSQTLITGFESSEGYTAGDLGTQQGWVSTLNNGSGSGVSSIVVSTAQHFDGTQSLLVTDNNTANRPIATYNLGSNLSAGTFTGSILRLNTNTTAWFMQFYTTSGTAAFSIESNGNSTITLKSGTNFGTTLGTYTDANLVNSFASWTTLNIQFSELSNTATVLLNGATILTSSDTTTNWSIGRVDLSVGYGGGTNLGSYFDGISAVPEPTTYAFLTMAVFVFGYGRLRRPRTI